MQKGRRLCKALLDQSLKQRPETTQGKHKRNRNVRGKAKQGGQHQQGMLGASKRTSVPAGCGHHVIEPGAKRKPTEKQKKKRTQRGWGHADTEQLPLRCQSPAEPHRIAPAKPAPSPRAGPRQRGQFLASVLGPYLCLALTCASGRPCSPPRLSPSGHEGRGVGRRGKSVRENEQGGRQRLRGSQLRHAASIS